MSTGILATEPPAPTAGLIASLTARTFLDTAQDGTVFGALLLTYPTPQFEDIDPGDVEWKMRGVAAAAGALHYTPSTPVPRVGARITAHGSSAMLWLAGCPYGLDVKHPRWVATATTVEDVLIVVGTAALSPTASAAEVDEYREHFTETGDLYVAMASIGSPRAVRATVRQQSPDRMAGAPRAHSNA